MLLKLCNGMDRRKPSESYNLVETLVEIEAKRNRNKAYKPLVYGISHHAPGEKAYEVPGINLFFRKESKDDYKKVLIATIEQYLPMSYEEFKKLDLDEQQLIIDEIKTKQGIEEQDIFQKKLNKLLEKRLS